MAQQVKWIDDYTAIINGGNQFKFTGVIKGVQLFPHVTYYASSVEVLTDGLKLEEWIYCIEEIGGNGNESIRNC